VGDFIGLHGGPFSPQSHKARAAIGSGEQAVTPFEAIAYRGEFQQE
jgi:hypothetical protein